MAQRIGDSVAPNDSSLIFENSSQRQLAIAGNGAIQDATGGQRALFNSVSKTIVDASATSLFNVDCQPGFTCGGSILYTVLASDGTDFQTMSGLVTYAAVNKATVLTLTITNATGNDAKAVSAGTLTLAWTFVTGTGLGTVKLQPTGSLVETVYTVKYTVFPVTGTVTIV